MIGNSSKDERLGHSYCILSHLFCHCALSKSEKGRKTTTHKHLDNQTGKSEHNTISDFPNNHCKVKELVHTITTSEVSQSQT